MITVIPNFLPKELSSNLVELHKKATHYARSIPSNPSSFQESLFITEHPYWNAIEPILMHPIRMYLDDHSPVPSTVRDALMLQAPLIYKGDLNGTPLHFDSICSGKFVRYLICSVYLNKVQGGELSFPQQEVTVPCDVGTLVLFPSHIICPHKVSPCVGNRYMLRADLVDYAWQVSSR